MEKKITGIMDAAVLNENHNQPYHYHREGFETFLVLEGSVGATVNGRRFTLHAGDMIHLEPWLPHRFTFPEEGCRLLWLQPEGMTRPEGQDQILPDPVNLVDADKRAVEQVSCKDEGTVDFGFEGIRLYLKTGRWHLGGFHEIWECRMDAGYRLQLSGEEEKETFYLANGGRFQVEMAGETRFAGGTDHRGIRIPPHTPCRITAVSEDCALLACNVSAHLFRLLEMIEAAQTYFPEKLADPEYLAYLFTVNKAGNFKSFQRVEETDAD